MIDNLDKPGGQCSELYPDKPIFDIPGVPYQTAQEHVDALLKQIEPFSYDLILNERVDELLIIMALGLLPQMLEKEFQQKTFL